MNRYKTKNKEAEALRRILESQLTNSQDFMKTLEQNLNNAEEALEEKRKITAHNRWLALRTIITGLITSAAIILIAVATQASGSNEPLIIERITSTLENSALGNSTLGSSALGSSALWSSALWSSAPRISAPGSIYTILYTIITACLANIAIITITLTQSKATFERKRGF